MPSARTGTGLRIVQPLLIGLIFLMILGAIGPAAASESSYGFSGNLDFLLGTDPWDSGEFLSNQLILSVTDASAGMTVTLYTKSCQLQCTDPGAEIPTWWRIWDSNADEDGELESGELIDTGWIAVADFIADWDKFEIEIKPPWSGKIRFQLKMERKGYGNPAGYYECSLGIGVQDVAP